MPKKSGKKGSKKGSPKLKPGQVAFSNGAIAQKGLNPKNPNLLTIVKGPTKGNSGPRGMKALSPKGAAAAFNKFYTETARYSSPKARQAAITRDLCHKKSPAKTVRTNKYSSIKGRRTGPLSFDYPDLDDGSRCPTGPGKASKAGTPEMKAKMAALRAKKMAGGASPKAVSPLAAAAIRAKAEGKCFYNPTTMRCAKGPFEGAKSPQWCRVGKKGVCKKTAKGKRGSPKNPAAVARGKALYAALKASKE